MEVSNWIVIGFLLLTRSGLDEVQAKCTLTPLQGERTIAYVCVHGDLADVAEVPSEAEWIEFTVSRIDYLPPDAFSRFHDLRRLTFHNCDLRRLSPDAFRGLDGLEWLVMSNTKIGLASAALLRHLKNLRRLTLDGAGLVYVEPEVFRPLRRLETLSLRDNDLDCLPIDALASLASLKSVRIGKNPWLCDCRSSLGKFFEERMIEHGPDEECISEMHDKSVRSTRSVYECMTVLEYPPPPASRASFDEIERHYRGRFEWRESVATGISNLERLPDEIGWIQLLDVEIPTIPRYAFFRFGNTLRSVELENCAVGEIEREAFAGLHKLERLTLTGNRLTTLKHESFGDLARLTDLVLRHNGIESIEENSLTHLRSLRRLDLAGNRLRCLSEDRLRGLVALERFEAAGNPWICGCKGELEDYLRRMRIGYETSSGCDVRTHPTEERDEHQLTRNSTTSGKVRWSWAYEIRRPGPPSPGRPTFATTSGTPKIIVEPTRPPRNGGCRLVPSASAENVDTCVCTGASLDDLADLPDGVESIVYSVSVTPTIRNDVFRKFGRYLKRLEFRECAVQSIERRAFHGLRNLETLVIRGNDLELVRSEWFEETTHLRRLDLGRNGITRISNGVFDRLPNLVSLDVSENRMNCIGVEHLEALRHLRRFEMVGNPWTCLCATRLLRFMTDRRISCNCNPDVIIERTEGGWGCHGTDDFSARPTSTSPTYPTPVTTSVTRPVTRPVSPIDHSSTTVPHPTPLPVGRDASGTCYPSRETAREDRWWRCDDGDISILSRIPSYATKVEIIDSHIPHLPALAFDRFRNLTELVLRNCTLRDVDSRAFAGLDGLAKLTLRDNRFTVAKNGWFRDTRNLVWLDMSDNHLSEIEARSFEEPKKLEYLNLEGNHFRCIYTSSFVDLPRLTTLEFGRNPLKWRCWQELRQFLEIRAVDYTYHKCPHDGKDLVRNLLKDDKGQARQSSSSAGSTGPESTIITALLVVVASLCI